MRKKWKVYGLFVLLIIILGVCFLSYDSSHFTSKLVSYQGNNLRVSIDGATSTSLPTSGTYYLISYECDNDKTEISWNSSSYELTVSNGKNGGGVSCDLTFKSTPKLYELPVGSYVAYIGSGGTVGSTSVACQTNGSESSSAASAGTEAPNSCSGQNAREDLDTSGYTYGYCYNTNYKYYTTGWRIAYIDTTDASNPRAILISAGSPECIGRPITHGNVDYIENSNYIRYANENALKYCNTNYVDGNCTCTRNPTVTVWCSSPSTDAWAINDTDFYYMTKAISGYGKRLAESSSSLGDSGGSLGTTLSCSGKYSYQECGYNNDLLDNGGYYWFAAQYRSSDDGPTGMYWDPVNRIVNGSANTDAYGLRPVIRLSSSVYVTGGSGTMNDPYTIGNANVTINEGSSGLDRTLTIFSTDATMMCFSNTSSDASDCSNWVTYATSYNWRLSDGIGTKTVYAFFKNASGNIHSTMDTIEITSEVGFSVNEDFEDGTIDSNLTFSTDDVIPWSVTNGRFQSASVGIGNESSTAKIQFTPILNATLSFDYGVSASKSYNQLTIILTGSDSSSTELLRKVSTGGSISNITLQAGVTYTLSLSFSNSYFTTGYGYIDNLVIQ